MTNTKKGLLESESKEFAEHVHINQQKLSSELRTNFDYIVVGAGTSGSVVAGRLASDIKTHVLLLEAGGSDETELITDANPWPMMLGSGLDLGLHDGAQPKVEWKVPSPLNGQGPGRWIEHQCLDLVAWTPGRLGLLC